MTLARVVVRLPEGQRERLGAVRERYFRETSRRPSRAALVRELVARGLASLDESRPLVEQLPLPPREPSKRGEGPTLRGQILNVLKAHAGEVLTTARVTELLRARRADKVRSTLQRMAVQRTIEKVGLGQWRAAGASGPARGGGT